MKNLILFGLIGASIITNVVLFAGKGSAASKAQAEVRKAREDAAFVRSQTNDIILNNNLLWSIVDSTWKSPDKSRAFIKRLADSQRVPRCNGKACAGNEDEARLRTNIVSNAQERSITVGWGSSGKTSMKYYFKVIYDGRDRFVTIDASDLLGQALGQDTEEEAEGEEES
ncbi:MAG: hypothetical protein LBU89_07155 [Fibromonadaceae bacterium]|jgi:hypothetical protein|nr:hypothetical protein [Fibromonadaceae bacterium]